MTIHSLFPSHNHNSSPITQQTFLAGQIADLTSTPKRVISLWADAGALKALPNTDRRGRGVQRRFPWLEVEIAAVLHAVHPFKIPIAEMRQIRYPFEKPDQLQLLYLNRARSRTHTSSGLIGDLLGYTTAIHWNVVDLDLWKPRHQILSLNLVLAWKTLFPLST